ncbi:MAG: hypothetical protein HYX25_09475 [Candidatus Solibacter usitatus]|nr:hypothetical protein [Candidatus Solibacter usitatus]
MAAEIRRKTPEDYLRECQAEEEGCAAQWFERSWIHFLLCQTVGKFQSAAPK